MYKYDNCPPENALVRNKITFYGNFWNMYPEYFDYFKEIFSINPCSQNIVARIDYAIDFIWVSVKDLYDSLSVYPKNMKTELTHRELSYFKIQTNRTSNVVYNKKLDILENKKYLIFDNSQQQPYRYIIDLSHSLTRYEYRRHADAFRGIPDSSLDYCLANIRSDAIQSFNSKFGKTLPFEKRTYSQLQDYATLETFGKKRSIYITRMNSYHDSLRQLCGNKTAYQEVEKMTGDNYLAWALMQPATMEFWDSINTETYGIVNS